ncbi:DUF2637 domain-containing protein [Streptomyces sp. NBC_00287]|uniref:DUF2637 domain-containing protein n=1 Tax=Streptomyces sp. NBC_00287 TaxID=2975702 RepID=UPI002E2BF749|nr:DUF2637 domain-containing protein [Streptomyces sp. NBC_00287]
MEIGAAQYGSYNSIRFGRELCLARAGRCDLRCGAESHLRDVTCCCREHRLREARTFVLSLSERAGGAISRPAHPSAALEVGQFNSSRISNWQLTEHRGTGVAEGGALLHRNHEDQKEGGTSRAIGADAKAVPEPRQRAARRTDSETWLRRGCCLVVASVAAYASYIHQRSFALQGGADPASATLWPLSVDGLLLLATVGLLKPAHQVGRRARAVVWIAFLLGISVSLAANIAAAPALTWKPVLVAGWPPVALLFSVELLAHRSGDGLPTETIPSDQPLSPDGSREPEARQGEGDELASAERGSRGGRESGTSGSRTSSRDRAPITRRNAEQRMWEYFQSQQAAGRTPTGTELDRVAGTNNYGRAVLRQWRRTGRIPSGADE